MCRIREAGGMRVEARAQARGTRGSGRAALIDSGAQMRRPRELATPWLPFLLGCAVMAPAIPGEFLNWDDPFSVVHNAAVQSGDWSAVLSQVTLGIWHPVTLASFALERSWLGPDAWH